MSLCTPLSCTKITLSILDGASRLRFALTINPAVENTRSEGVLVAGIANMDLASMERHGKVCCCVDHHDSTSSAETDGGAPTDGRRHQLIKLNGLHFLTPCRSFHERMQKHAATA
jgi:hypothetical protein